MNQAFDLPSLNLDADQAVSLITDLLIESRYQVLPSFDLQAARAARILCPCPHHGTARCDCQMVVLLIYGQEEQPASLVIHGQDGKSFLTLVDNAQQRPDNRMLQRIWKTLARLPSQRSDV